MNKRSKLFILLMLGIVISFIITYLILNPIKKENEITYTQAQNMISNGQIEKVKIAENSNNAILYEKESNKEYNTNIPNTISFSEFMEEERKNGNEVTYDIVKKRGISSTFITIVYNAIFIIIIVRIFRKMSPTSKKEDDYSVSSKTTFSDVAGLENEKLEVEEVVNFLKDPSKYRKMGARTIKGILLRGDPGTGKTLIAKAIAGESKVPFYACSGSSFDNVYVGLGASKVRDIFKKAKRTAPSIIFIDEFDTVARKRYDSGAYNEQTLNQLLSEMDGINDSSNVVVIAATNHYDILDNAITRPGRFDRIIDISMPDKKAREEILRVHAFNKKFSNDNDKEEIIKELALKTAGMSGAYLENILNESAIIAIRNTHNAITKEDVDEAFIKTILGISKDGKEVSKEEKYLTAIHEAGHALCSRITKPNIKILQVSIVPRGSAGGYTLHEDDDKGIPNKQDLISNIIIDLGGRAAEEAIFNTISAGASSDLKHATDTSHNMVYRFGMGEKNQLVRIFGEDQYNAQLEEKMLPEMEKIISESYKRALEIVNENKNALLSIADELMKNSTVDSKRIEEIFLKFGI